MQVNANIVTIMSAVPSIDSLDFAWVSAQVGIPNAVSMTKTKFGNGIVGNCYRLTIDTSDGRNYSVIAKCPSQNQKMFHAARGLHFYDKEVFFYRLLASELPIRTPKCYFAQRDEDGKFLLLLEDLSPSAAVDQFIGISLEVAKHGLKALAELHGCTFMKTELLQSSWLHLDSEEEMRQKLAMASTAFDMLLERMAKQIDDPTIETVMFIKERFLKPQGIYVPPKPCLVHRDFRTDNLLIDARNGEVPLATVDWQTVTVDSPMFDVAYFLVTSLTKEDCIRVCNLP